MAINSINVFSNNPMFIDNLGDGEVYVRILKGLGEVGPYGSTVVKNGSYSYAKMSKISGTASLFHTPNEIMCVASNAPNMTRSQFTKYINHFLTNVSSHITSDQLSAFMETSSFGLSELRSDGRQNRHYATDLAIDSGIYTTEKYGTYHYLTATGMNYILRKPEFINWISNICGTAITVR